VLIRSSFAVQTWLSRIAGLIIIFFALHILGLIKIRFLQSDHKLKAKRFKSSYLTSYVFGASFAVGWTPCVGAILGSIFALAVANPVNSFVLLLAYAIGLGLPFLIVGIFTEQAMAFIGKSEKILRYFNIIVGILLLVLGILVFTNNLTSIASFIVPQGFIS
jgi:cytochrome c-type biogenesis protein